MTSLATPEVMSSCGRDQDLARRRLQQKGDLFNQGGMWKLRWHEDKIGPDGELMRGWSRAVHIGPSAGAGKLTEKEARQKGQDIFVAKLPVAAIPRAKTMSETRGFIKVVIDVKTNQILGCAILSIEAGEMLGTVQMAMIAGLPFTALRDAVLSHPTMVEGFNNLPSNPS